MGLVLLSCVSVLMDTATSVPRGRRASDRLLVEVRGMRREWYGAV